MDLWRFLNAIILSRWARVSLDMSLIPAISYVAAQIRIGPDMCLDVIHYGDYPSLARWEVLVSIHLEEFIGKTPVGAPNLSQGRVGGSDIYVLLSLRLSTEGASSHFIAAVSGEPF